MTILAGLWRFSRQAGQPDLSTTVSAIIDAQHASERALHGRSCVRVSDQIALGRSSDPAADRCGSQTFADDKLPGVLLAADARIDNRSELLDRLGYARAELIDDEGLIFLAYRRWGDRLVDYLVGDFAYAAWDPHAEALTLVRDPTGQRPLHYHLGRGFAAFASMPQGLLSLQHAGVAVNPDRLAQFMATLPQWGPESFFRGIFRVEPAQIVRITKSGVRTERYWTMPTRELHYRNPDDYAEAFREVLDRATEARLRGSGAVVAAHLSAGLDSGTVATTAARLSAATGGRVVAVTSAPRADFAGPVPRGRIADESPLAGIVAAQYANMDHVVLRSTGTSPLDLLDADVCRFGQPVGHVCNNVWWHQANDAARANGATVMLTGEMGNLTVSAGGLGVLADYLRAGRYMQWAREVVALKNRGPRWRGLMSASFGPWIPRTVFASLHRFAAGGRLAPLETLIAGRYREMMEAEAARIETARSRLSEREIRWEALKLFDSGTFRKAAWLTSGIDERDPTADRRLVEFCFSLPPSQLLGSGETRRLARTALADRLPPAILNGPRGYQYADWYESLDRESLARAARRIAASPIASQVIDIDAVDRLIAAWPPRDWASMQTIGAYRSGLLRAISAGIFALKAGN